MWKEMMDEMDGIRGRTGFYYKNLVTGETVERRAKEGFRAASVMKLPILAAMLSLWERGETDFSQRIPIREEDKIPGCGALQHITGSFDMDIASLYKLMITISDNTATNVLIGHYTPERINGELRALGMATTQVNRKLYDFEKEEMGIQNYFSPEEIGLLLEKMYFKTFISSEASRLLEEILLQQQINHKMLGYLSEEIPAAHKTGEEDVRTHDVGVVYAREPFVICYASDETDVPEFERFIRKTTKRIYDKIENNAC